MTFWIWAEILYLITLSIFESLVQLKQRFHIDHIDETAMLCEEVLESMPKHYAWIHVMNFTSCICVTIDSLTNWGLKILR